MNENQRKMFELISKPGLGKKELQKHLTLESIRNSTKKMSKIDLKKITFAIDEDPLSMRIWEMLDPDTKKEIVIGIYYRSFTSALKLNKMKEKMNLISQKVKNLQQ